MLKINTDFIARRVCLFLFYTMICIFSNIFIYKIYSVLEFPLREFLISFISLFSMEQIFFLAMILRYIKNYGKVFCDNGDFNYWCMKFPCTKIFRILFILENIAHIIYGIYIFIYDFPKISLPILIFFQLIGYFSLIKFTVAVIYFLCFMERSVSKKNFQLAYCNDTMFHINRLENVCIQFTIKIEDKQNIIKNKDTCPICLDNNIKEKWSKLDCGHTIHSECLRPWFLNNNSCPICRKLIFQETALNIE